MSTKQNVERDRVDRQALGRLGKLCEALCLVHDRRNDEGRRCHELGEHHESGFVLCWVHRQAMENKTRNYPLVCRSRLDVVLRFQCTYCGHQNSEALGAPSGVVERLIDCRCGRYFNVRFDADRHIVLSAALL